MSNEYGGMLYSTHGQMVEAMTWGWLTAEGLNVEADVDAWLREGEADGWEGLADEMIRDGWLDDEYGEPRDDVSRGNIIDSLAELARVRALAEEA